METRIPLCPVPHPYRCPIMRPEPLVDYESFCVIQTLPWDRFSRGTQIERICAIQARNGHDEPDVVPPVSGVEP